MSAAPGLADPPVLGLYEDHGDVDDFSHRFTSASDSSLSSCFHYLFFLIYYDSTISFFFSSRSLCLSPFVYLFILRMYLSIRFCLSLFRYVFCSVYMSLFLSLSLRCLFLSFFLSCCVFLPFFLSFFIYLFLSCVFFFLVVLLFSLSFCLCFFCSFF